MENKQPEDNNTQLPAEVVEQIKIKANEIYWQTHKASIERDPYCRGLTMFEVAQIPIINGLTEWAQRKVRFDELMERAEKMEAALEWIKTYGPDQSVTGQAFIDKALAGGGLPATGPTLNNDDLRAWKENEYPDLSSATHEQKAETISGLIELAAREVMKMFYAFGLKTHIECTVINDPTNEEFDFIFRKKGALSNEQPVEQKENEAVAFMKWSLESFCMYSATDEDQWTHTETNENITTSQLYNEWKSNK